MIKREEEEAVRRRKQKWVLASPSAVSQSSQVKPESSRAIRRQKQGKSLLQKQRYSSKVNQISQEMIQWTTETSQRIQGTSRVDRLS